MHTVGSRELVGADFDALLRSMGLVCGLLQFLGFLLS